MGGQAERLRDEHLVLSIVVPTLADMQHEVLAAITQPLQRASALVPGYGSILRLLVLDGLIWRFLMRRLITVLLLGALGSALLFAVARVARGPELIAAFLLMAVLTPIVLRLRQRPGSSLEAFITCASIGLIMGTTLWIWTLIDSGNLGRLPWYACVLTSAGLTGCVGFGSALAAAAAWHPAEGSIVRRRMLQVLGAAATFVVCYLTVYASGSRNALNPAGWAAFLGFFFAAVSTATYLPVLLSIRKLMAP